VSLLRCQYLQHQSATKYMTIFLPLPLMTGLLSLHSHTSHMKALSLAVQRQYLHFSVILRPWVLVYSGSQNQTCNLPFCSPAVTNHGKTEKFLTFSFQKLKDLSQHFPPVSKHKKMRSTLWWTISYKSLYFVHLSLDLMPLFTGMQERSIIK